MAPVWPKAIRPQKEGCEERSDTALTKKEKKRKDGEEENRKKREISKTRSLNHGVPLYEKGIRKRDQQNGHENSAKVKMTLR